MESCLRCGGMELKKYGKAKGKIRKKCARCGYQQTRDIARGRSQRDKALALVLYLSGLSMNMTGKIIGVSTQTIMRWIRAWSEKLGQLVVLREMKYEGRYKVRQAT
ncbi:helix-turn-helix domain-containing protein [Candidatus Jidaibacter acanthamoebae]|nr:helix-turn-helix domain-containing protein [Candidatus Jidaibacter acanthamoeba]